MARERKPEEILQEARQLIGYETKPVYGEYPVEHEPIRRYCHMCNDDNPLFLDPEYAKNTRYGAVIAPPMAIHSMVRLGSMAGSWPPTRPQEGTVLPSIPTPGDRAINLTTEWEFFIPVKVGDRLSVSQRIAEVYMKPIRLDPKAFWILTERVYRNQNREVVATMRNLGLRHRSPEEVKAAGDLDRG